MLDTFWDQGLDQVKIAAETANKSGRRRRRI
jgi:hypothetical protein